MPTRSRRARYKIEVLFAFVAGGAHQRCTVHKLRSLVAKATKHGHDAVSEDYHQIVYDGTLDAAQDAYLSEKRSSLGDGVL